MASTTYSKVVTAGQRYDFAGITDSNDYSTFTISTARGGTFSDRTHAAHSVFDVNSIGTVSLTNGIYGGIFADIGSDHGVGNVTIVQQGGTTKSGSSNEINIEARDGNIGNFLGTVTGIGGSGDWQLNATGAIGNITINNTSNVGEASIIAQADKSIGNFTFNDTGINHDSQFILLATEQGNVGNILFNETGRNVSGDAYVNASGNVGNVTMNVGGWSNGWLDIYASGGGLSSGNVGNVSITTTTTGNAAGGSAGFQIDAAQNIGNVTLTAGGNYGQIGEFGTFWGSYDSLNASGSIGNINATATGFESSAYFSANADAGNIGNLTIAATGKESYVGFGASADNGNIGNITINTTGISASAGGSAYAETNIGNVTIGAAGLSSYGSYDFSAGDNVGNVSVTATGLGAEASAYVSAGFDDNSGNIGNVTLAATGVNSSVDVSGSAYGSIGNITMTANGNDASVSGYFEAYNLSIGNISVTAAGIGASGDVSAYASANVGNITLLATGKNSDVSGHVEGSGSIGNVILKATGVNSYAYGDVDAGSGSAGDLTVLASNVNASAFLTAGLNNGLESDFGNISVNATAVGAIASVFMGYGIWEQWGADHLGNINLAATASGAFAGFSGAVISGMESITVAASNSASGGFSGTALDGVSGDIKLTATNNSHIDFNFSAVTGDIGNIVINSTDSVTNAYASGFGSYVGSGESDAGNLTINNTSGYVYAEVDMAGSIGNVTINNTNGYTQVSALASWGEDAYHTGDWYHSTSGSIGNVTVTNTGEAYTNGWFSAGSDGIGNVLVTNNTTGAISDAHVNLQFLVENGGNLGDITLINKGTGFSGGINVSANVYGDGGIIGNVTATGNATTTMGTNTYVNLDVASGSVGDIVFNAVGNNLVSGRIEASGIYEGSGIDDGNVGNITLNASGTFADAQLNVSADGGYDDGVSGDGSIGTITINASGSYGGVYVSASTSGGTIGEVTARVVNTVAYSASVEARAFNTGGESGYISDIDMKLINTTGAYSGGLNVSARAYGGDIGNISLTSSGSVKGEMDYMGVSAQAFTRGGLGGVIGDITINNQSVDGGTIVFLAAAVEAGDVTATIGNGDSTFSGIFRAAGDNGNYSGDYTLSMGNIAIHAGLDNIMPSGGSGDIRIDFSAGSGGTMTLDVGNITIDGGSKDSHATIAIDSSYSAGYTGSMGNIDLSNFNGSAYIDLADFDTSGVTISGAIGGNSIYGSRGADTITGGSGADYISGGIGQDDITGGSGADTFAFNEGDSYLSGGVYDEIHGFQGGSIDSIEYDTGEGLVDTVGNISVAADGYAHISAKGIATFTGADDTLAERVAAVENALSSNSDGSGYVAGFTYDGNAYAFISDGNDGVNNNDILIKLVGVTSFTGDHDEIVISEDGHSFSLA